LPHEVRFADSRRSVQIHEAERAFTIRLCKPLERAVSKSIFFDNQNRFGRTRRRFVGTSRLLAVSILNHEGLPAIEFG